MVVSARRPSRRAQAGEMPVGVTGRVAYRRLQNYITRRECRHDRDHRRGVTGPRAGRLGIEVTFGLCPRSTLLAQLQSHGIRLVPIRHEAARVHMAEGLYKTTGKVAAVLGNPAPARPTSSRRRHRIARRRPSAGHHLPAPARHRLPVAAVDLPGQDQLDLFRPAVKWADRSSNGPASPKWCGWRSARCATAGPVRFTSTRPLRCLRNRRRTPRRWPAGSYRVGQIPPCEHQLDEAAALPGPPGR